MRIHLTKKGTKGYWLDFIGMNDGLTVQVISPGNVFDTQEFFNQLVFKNFKHDPAFKDFCESLSPDNYFSLRRTGFQKPLSVSKYYPFLFLPEIKEPSSPVVPVTNHSLQDLRALDFDTSELVEILGSIHDEEFVSNVVTSFVETFDTFWLLTDSEKDARMIEVEKEYSELLTRSREKLSSEKATFLAAFESKVRYYKSN